MKSSLISVLGAAGLTLVALTSGCGGEGTGAPEDVDTELSPSEPTVSFPQEAVKVKLERIGTPKWQPVDFHLFSAEWSTIYSIVETLLPPPKHAWHPDLAMGPGVAHAGPYEEELEDGVKAAGFVDKSTFTAAEFTDGLILTWMVVPKNKGAPKGSSPDFVNGSIIPNALFPIHVEFRYSRNGVVDSFVSTTDVPPLDQSVSPPFNVDGHSHFPMFANDSIVFYPPGTPAAGSYQWLITMIDTKGEGWDIEVPYTIQ